MQFSSSPTEDSLQSSKKSGFDGMEIAGSGRGRDLQTVAQEPHRRARYQSVLCWCSLKLQVLRRDLYRLPALPGCNRLKGGTFSVGPSGSVPYLIQPAVSELWVRGGTR